MKLLLLLLFVAVYYGAKFFFRAKDVAAEAYKAAREGSIQGLPGGIKTTVENAQREAMRVADYVGEVVPGARMVAFEFSMWVQSRLSIDFPLAVRPAELQSPAARAKAGAFLAGALEAYAEYRSLSFPNPIDFERFMRQTLTQVSQTFIGTEGVENGMRFLLGADDLKTPGALAWIEGGSAVRLGLRGHEPSPLENPLRTAIREEPPKLVNGS